MEENVKRIKKVVARQFFLAMLFSVMFVAGIPLIVFFAGKNYIVMAVGIVMVVLGFYGTPIIWSHYGELKTTKRVIEAAMEEKLFSVNEIALQLQMSEKNVAAHLRKAINKKYMTGFLFNGTVLTQNEKLIEKTMSKCPYCGGSLDENVKSCPYCGAKF